jgi:3-oxoacyl-[acyl-carrier protein] reductase
MAAELAGKTALVTGASKGIGRGIALALAEAGCDVAVSYFGDEKGARAVAKEIESLDRKAVIVPGDAGRAPDVDRMIETAAAAFGRLHIWVNNAGIQVWKPLLDLTEEDWDRVIQTNLKGTFLGTQRAARHMKAFGGGRIINLGSGCNKIPFPNLVSYTASKGGIEMLTRVSAVELGPLGITVNCVAPGAIEIERTRQEAEDYAGTWAPVTPVRRIGHPADIAQAIRFLASDAAEFITGQTLYVDGGLFVQGPWPYRNA